MQVVKDVLLKLQRAASTEHKYHFLRETRCPNGQIRDTVLFSPTIKLRRSRGLGTADELSEVLVRYTTADEHSVSRPPRADIITIDNIMAANRVYEVRHETVEEKEHTVSPKRVSRIRSERDWTRIDEDNLKVHLRTMTPGFEIPHWLGYTDSNIEYFSGSPRDVLDIFPQAARKFDSLKSKEVVWVYRDLFFYLYTKIKEMNPRLLGHHIQ